MRLIFPTHYIFCLCQFWYFLYWPPLFSIWNAFDVMLLSRDWLFKTLFAPNNKKCKVNSALKSFPIWGFGQLSWPCGHLIIDQSLVQLKLPPICWELLLLILYKVRTLLVKDYIEKGESHLCCYIVCLDVHITGTTQTNSYHLVLDVVITKS